MLAHRSSNESGPQMIASKPMKADELFKEENLCLMANTTIEELESKQEEEVDFNNPESLKQAYHELLSNSFILSKAYNCLKKDFKKFSRDHIEFQEKHEAIVNKSLAVTTQVCETYENSEIKIQRK